MTDAAQFSSNEEPDAGETGGNAEHQGHVLPGDRQKQINYLKKAIIRLQQAPLNNITTLGQVNLITITE